MCLSVNGASRGRVQQDPHNAPSSLVPVCHAIQEGVVSLVLYLCAALPPSSVHMYGMVPLMTPRSLHMSRKIQTWAETQQPDKVGKRFVSLCTLRYRKVRGKDRVWGIFRSREKKEIEDERKRESQTTDRMRQKERQQPATQSKYPSNAYPAAKILNPKPFACFVHPYSYTAYSTSNLAPDLSLRRLSSLMLLLIRRRRVLVLHQARLLVLGNSGLLASSLAAGAAATAAAAAVAGPAEEEPPEGNEHGADRNANTENPGLA